MSINRLLRLGKATLAGSHMLMHAYVYMCAHLLTLLRRWRANMSPSKSSRHCYFAERLSERSGAFYFGLLGQSLAKCFFPQIKHGLSAMATLGLTHALAK